MAERKSRVNLVLSHFAKADQAERFQIMRRIVDDLESVALSLQTQLKQVTADRALLLGMIDILKDEPTDSPATDKS